MSTTAQELVDAAIGRRTSNDPETLAGRKEMLRLLNRTLKRLSVQAAGVQPRYFGASSDVTGTTTWAIPGTAIRIFEIQAAAPAGTGTDAVLAAGAEVHLVDLADTDAELAPRVYQLGLSLYSVGETGDPVAGANGDVLRLFYSKELGALNVDGAYSQTLDAQWRDRHNDLLVAILAKYLRNKDGDEQAAGALVPEIEEHEAIFQADVAAYASASAARWR